MFGYDTAGKPANPFLARRPGSYQPHPLAGEVVHAPSLRLGGLP